MHSINNLFKLNEITKVDYDSMQLDELKRNKNVVKSLLNNKTLVKGLKDQGAKLKLQFEKIERLINSKEKKENDENKTEDTVVTTKSQVDSILNKFESNLQLDEKSESPNDKMESSPNINSKEKTVTINFFEKPIATKAKNENKPINRVYDEARFSQVKEKMLTKMKQPENSLKTAKMIPLDECFKLLKEHERKIQVNY
jgi:hypothetical protein